MAGLPIANSIAQAGSLLMRVKELEEQHLAYRNSVVCAFNQLLDLKDINTGVHSTRLAEWAIRVARKLNIAEEHLYQVEVAALLHDIGKIGVPDAILSTAGLFFGSSPASKTQAFTLYTIMRTLTALDTPQG